MVTLVIDGGVIHARGGRAPAGARETVMRTSLWTILARACLAAACALAPAPAARAQSFQTAAQHAILVDVDSGSTLFEKAADEPFAPASMPSS